MEKQQTSTEGHDNITKQPTSLATHPTTAKVTKRAKQGNRSKTKKNTSNERKQLLMR